MNEIVVGVDGSETARRAAVRAADLAVRLELPLHVVMCVPRRARNVKAGGDQWHMDSGTSGEQYVDSLIIELPIETATRTVSFGDPVDSLCDEARRLEASMIVVGNKRVQGAKRILGSVAGGVMHHAPCDVLIVHTTGD